MEYLDISMAKALKRKPKMRQPEEIRIEGQTLDVILKNHELWLKQEGNGVPASLMNANLDYANLEGANLSEVYFSGASLREANLKNANLAYSDLSDADLYHADLRGANLENAWLDWSCWPLCCNSLKVKIDRNLAIQMLFHLMSCVSFFRDY